MDFHGVALKLWSATQGVFYFVGFAFEMHKLESIGLHLLNPSGLPIREEWGWILEEAFQRSMIGSENEVAIT